jgi:hypothetical protein
MATQTQDSGQSSSGGNPGPSGPVSTTSGGGSDSTTPASGGTTTPSTTDTTNPDTSLADQLAANLAAIGKLMPDSLQPVAPQAPGSALTGRFSTDSIMQNWKMWAIVAVVLIGGFYLWKKYR